MEQKFLNLHPTNSNKRRSIQGLLLGILLLAALFSQGLSVSKVKAAGSTEALLLTCMDYRLINETEAYMSGRGLRDKYDHVILAGASLGAHNDKYPNWGQTFSDHLDVAINLHHIHKVIIMDHRDCGAYKVILGEDFAKDAVKETKIHTHQMNILADEIRHAHPNLEVELLLIDLAGKVEPVALEKANAAHTEEGGSVHTQH